MAGTLLFQPDRAGRTEAVMDHPSPDAPLVKFYRFLPGARAPQRADRSAAGSMPTRAFRYCEVMRKPPFLANDVIWSYEGEEGWFSLSAAQFPNFAQRFDEIAPPDIRGFSPPFLGAFKDPAGLMLWSGFVARTAPGWGLLIRPPANLTHSQGYESYEGIIETDRWFGPLFVNLKLTRPNVPIEFDANYPFLQVQPVQRSVYGDRLDRFEVVDGLEDLDAADWDDFRKTVSQPSSDPHRPRGDYAVKTRKRSKE